MTRLQAKDFLISLGIEEPTDEQVSNYLNTVNGEINKERIKADQYKKDADKTAELQAKLDELNAQNMTDIEKAQNDTKVANERIALLEKQIKEAEIRKSLADKGISGEDADSFVKSFMDGIFNAESFALIYENGIKSAVADYEKKILANTPNPQGKNGDEGKEEKTEMDKAVDIVKSAIAPSSKSADIINAYA